MMIGLGLSWALAAQAAAPPLVLQGGRFEVQTTWRTSDGQTGVGTPSPLTSETGTFWFFSPSNVEVIVKVLDACSSPSDRFWVFAGGLTDVAVDMTVTDTASGETKVYHNPPSTPFRPIQDTAAFATCDAAPRCGQGTFAELAEPPRADPEIEHVAAILGGSIAAPQGLYERLVADVASVRAQRPTLDLHFVPRNEPQTLIVGLSSSADPAWDCLNRWYRVDRIDRLPNVGAAVLHFSRILNVERIVDDYEALPGVTYAEVNGYLPPPIPIPQDRLCAWRDDGDRILYFVWPATRQIEYFSSQPGEAPVARGSVGASIQLGQWAEICFNGIGPYGFGS